MNPILRRYVLRYTLVGGALTGLLAFAVSVAMDLPTPPVGLVLLLFALLVLPFLVGVTDTGLEAAAAGAAVGSGTSDPESLQPGFGDLNRAAFACYLVGVGLAGIVLIAVYYV